MTSYTYRTIDIRSNVVLEDVDLRDVSFSIKLSAVGSLDATLYVPDNQRGLLLDNATIPGRTGLYVLRDNVPVWGGIIWKRTWSEDTNTFRLSCGSWESYAYHYIQPFTKTYTGTDQLQIARELFTQTAIAAVTGITVPASGTSGRLRDRTMFQYERKMVGLELEQLAGLEDGFDYTVQSYIKSDGSFGRQYLFGYPRLGRSADLDASTDNLTFDYPGNLMPFELVEDAENSAWQVFLLGAGEGTEKLLADAADTSYEDAGWPNLDAVVSYPTVSVFNTLEEHAVEEMKTRLPPIDAWTFQIAPDSDVTLNDINIGDSATFRISSRRWPQALEMVRRIVEIRVKPGDTGTIETVQLGLGDEIS